MIRLLTSILFLTLTSQTVQADATPLFLSGIGQARYLGFINVYSASLYVDPASDTASVLAPETSRCLELTYDVSLTSENFIEGADTVLNRQYTAKELESVRPVIDQFHNAYKDVAKGDTYSLCYLAETGKTSLSLNDETLIEIDSPMFAKTYFGIWLAPDNPLDGDLRDALLSNLQDKENQNG